MCTKTSVIMLLISFCFVYKSNAQVELKGNVLSLSNKPVRGASVAIQNKKNGTLSDSSGRFAFYIHRPKKTDTLIITSIGYETLKIPVSAARQQSQFKLNEKFIDMSGVKVRSFNNRNSYGSILESAANFRGWNFDSTGGEIGRLFYIPHDHYKLDKVKFKVNNTCGNCTFRIHIRQVSNGLPDNSGELLKDSVALNTKSLLWLDNSQIPEFDLSAYNLVLSDKKIYVGIETIGCKPKDTIAPCSLCFVGTEKGKFVYKTNRKSDFEESFSEYDVYMKLELDY